MVIATEQGMLVEMACASDAKQGVCRDIGEPLTGEVSLNGEISSFHPRHLSMAAAGAAPSVRTEGMWSRFNSIYKAVRCMVRDDPSMRPVHLLQIFRPSDQEAEMMVRLAYDTVWHEMHDVRTTAEVPLNGHRYIVS